MEKSAWCQGAGKEGKQRHPPYLHSECSVVLEPPGTAKDSRGHLTPPATCGYAKEPHAVSLQCDKGCGCQKGCIVTRSTEHHMLGPRRAAGRSTDLPCAGSGVSTEFQCGLLGLVPSLIQDWLCHRPAPHEPHGNCTKHTKQPPRTQSQQSSSWETADSLD